MAEVKQAKKTQKKEFFEVSVPMTSAKVMLFASSQDELIGKFVRLDLTRSLRGKSLELKAKIKKEGNGLIGEPVSLELMGSFIRRMFRKGVDYVEDSFVAECRDNKIIIKLFLITRNKVSRAIRKELRNRAKDFILGHLKIRDSHEVFTEIMTNKIQKELSLKLKKIYPLALCEIRWFEILEEKK